jgi:ATP-dependent helicase HrpB
VGEEGATIAALLGAGRVGDWPVQSSRSDVLALLDAEWEPRAAQAVRQVRRIVNASRQRSRNDDALLLSVLAAFPDRVARRRQGNELLLASGGAAELARNSTVASCEFVVAVEAEHRQEQRLPLVRIASGIEPEWLLDLFPDRVRETRRVEWNRQAERVESVSALVFDALTIEESRGVPEPEAAAEMLAAKAMETGLHRFADPDEVAAFLARVEFAASHSPLVAFTATDVQEALAELAQGLRSFPELESAARGGGLLRALEQRLPQGGARMLEEVAPARLRLPGGRQVRVHYEPGQPPWIASRLQDFFGMRETPRVARGAVSLVVRLLAPNQRPVQMTTDLAGFWVRLYPTVRRELMRRYPRHAWPEDPYIAARD